MYILFGEYFVWKKKDDQFLICDKSEDNEIL